MTATKTPAAPAAIAAAADRRHPEPYVGQTVLWQAEIGDDKEVSVAIIVKVYEGKEGDPSSIEQVDLSCIVPGANSLWPKGGVRHISNPDLTKIRNAGVGVWRELPQDRDLFSLFQKANESAKLQLRLIEQLGERLAQVEGRMASIEKKSGRRPERSGDDAGATQ